MWQEIYFEKCSPVENYCYWGKTSAQCGSINVLLNKTTMESCSLKVWVSWSLCTHTSLASGCHLEKKETQITYSVLTPCQALRHAKYSTRVSLFNLQHNVLTYVLLLSLFYYYRNWGLESSEVTCSRPQLAMEPEYNTGILIPEVMLLMCSRCVEEIKNESRAETSWIVKKHLMGS